MYAVVAPGIHGVYTDTKTVERIRALYPYAKIRNFRDEDECWKFVNRYKNSYALDDVYNYGKTFDNMFVTMEYFIRDSLYFNYDTSKVGYIKIISDRAVVNNKAELITARLDNIALEDKSIFGHLIAIYHGLKLIGDMLDVNVVVPDHSVFYALNTYTGNNRVISRVRSFIDSRQGKVSLTIRKIKPEYMYYDDM